MAIPNRDAARGRCDDSGQADRGPRDGMGALAIAGGLSDDGTIGELMRGSMPDLKDEHPEWRRSAPLEGRFMTSGACDMRAARTER